MPKLTVLEIRNAKGPCLLSDGEGLFFEITATNIKRWIYRYKINGKGGKYTIGRYPALSLAKARTELQEAKEIVKEGKNPAQHRRTQKLEKQLLEQMEKDRWKNNFHTVALDWIEKQKDVWSNDHAQAVLTTLKKDVFGMIGDEPIDTITPPDVLKVIRKIESRGSLEIARKVLQRMSSIFRYAIQTGKATYNPAADMQGVIKKKAVEHIPAVYNNELARLLQDINKNTKIYIGTKLALQLTAYTACRSGEIRGAHWSEIDLEQKEWKIPAERMKMRREHVVPLSSQAMAIIQRAGILFGTEGLVFPSQRNREKPMSDNTMSKALRDMGYRGIATPHGFRSSFSSMAHEKSGAQSEVIEKALAHGEKNKIKAAYNRAEYIEQRRELLQWWADLLQELENSTSSTTQGGNVNG